MVQQSTLNFIYFLAVIGGLVLAVFLAKILWTLIKTILPEKNYAQRYGEHSWAVVTGGSDGIGLGFCEEFAGLGFNICMIARNQQKMKNALEQIRQKCNSDQEEAHKIKTAYVIADFADSQKQGFFENLFKQLKDQGILDDISVLVNNVGISNLGYLHEIPDRRLLNQININCVPMVLMSNYTIPYMLKREKRSAIINVSSFTAQSPAPYVSTYSATKSFNDTFSKAIELQYSSQIDIMSLKPLFVESQMSKKKANCHVATRNQCARATIKYLALDYETNGYWIHRLIAYTVGILPTPLTRGMSESESKKIMEKQKKESNSNK